MSLPILAAIGGSDWLLLASLAIVLAIVARRFYRQGGLRRRNRAASSQPLLVYPYTAPSELRRDRPAVGDPAGRFATRREPPRVDQQARSPSRDISEPLHELEPELPLSAAPVAEPPEPAIQPELPRRVALDPAPTPLAPRRVPLQRPDWPANPPNGRPLAAPIPPRYDELDEAANAVTMQLLPGRLDVMAGPDAGMQIRFVKPNRPGVPEYTLGRAPAQDLSHIQIRGGTVSRVHASMRYVDGKWTLVNRSTTNPTRVGGRELSGEGESHVLVDGDQIELGEVVLRYFNGRSPGGTD